MNTQEIYSPEKDKTNTLFGGSKFIEIRKTRNQQGKDAAIAIVTAYASQLIKIAPDSLRQKDNYLELFYM